ncbi:MAG: thymidylate synthase [Thermoproteota archaeon]
MYPVLFVEGSFIPEVWEKSIIELWNRGIYVKTEYGGSSKDCTMLMVIRTPLNEPRIHRAGLMVGRLSQLEEYVQEICDGIHDSYVKSGVWPYTYHERLRSYTCRDEIIDQINYVTEKLSRAPYSRRAQAITWKPWIDTRIDDPPCLQRIWFRVYGNRLIIETCWRSRDALKAAFMNIYALTELQKRVAEELSKRTKTEIVPGEYLDFSNSYHIYDSDFNKAEGLVKKSMESDWRKRSWSTEEFKSLISREKRLQTHTNPLISQ